MAQENRTLYYIVFPVKRCQSCLDALFSQKLQPFIGLVFIILPRDEIFRANTLVLLKLLIFNDFQILYFLDYFDQRLFTLQLKIISTDY